MASGVDVKMGVTGISQFKNAMNQAQQSVKTLDAALKLNEKQFQATGDKETYMQQKSKLLQQQIAAQNTVIKQAQQALAAMEKNGVNPASEAYQKMQRQMLEAQAGLLNMQGDLSGVGSAAAQAAQGTDQLTESVNSINKKVSFDAVIDGIGAITDGMEAAGRRIAELARNAWDAMADSAAWADNENTLAAMYGIDVETLQRMQGASRTIDTSVEAIIKSRQKLKQSMESDSKDIKAAFQDLGVSVGYGLIGKEGEKQVFRDWEDVFWDTGAALLAFTDDVKRDVYANQIFGKSWQELLPLFQAGRDEYEKTLKEQSIVSEENVNKLNELDDALQKLDQEFQTLKTTVLSTLAPAFSELAKGATDLLRQFNEYLATDEGKEKMEALSNSITELFSGLTDVDFGQVIETAKNGIDSITTSLEWIHKNKDDVVTAIKAIGAAFLGLKAAEIGMTIGRTVEGWKGLLGGGASAIGASAATGAGASTAGTAAGAAAGATLATEFSAAFAEGFLPTVGGAAWVAAPIVAVVATEMEHAAFVEETEKRLEGIKEKARASAQETGKQQSDAAEAISEAVEAMMPDRAVSDAFGVTSMQRSSEIDSTVAAWQEKTMDFISNRTRLLLESSGDEGTTSMATHELANQAMDEALRELRTPRNLQRNDQAEERAGYGLLDMVSDVLDVIDQRAEEREEDPYNPENLENAYNILDRIIEDSRLTDALSEETRKKLASYVNEESGFGAGGPTQYTDALELISQIAEEYNRMFSPDAREEEYRRSMGKEYELLQAHAKELEQKKPAEPLADVVSDTLDSILQVQENLDDDLSVENIEALYSMIDQISQNKRLMDSLPETTRELLGRYFDEESGFGAGSNGQFTDARQVLDTLFQNLSGVWDQLMKGNEKPEVEVDPALPTDTAQRIQEQLNAGTYTIPVTPYLSGEMGGVDGEHANGLPFVPFDGYIAALHRGERVVPANQNKSYTANSNLYVEKMYMNGVNAQGLAAAMAAENRRVRSGFGS